jgi:hypothetical protein
MSEWDFIEYSKSSTASAVLLVWQNQKRSSCVDSPPLNRVPVRYSYPMLRSDYIFSSLAGKHFFRALDAVKGYHPVELAETDGHKTAFITHRGLFQFERMPFGLRQENLVRAARRAAWMQRSDCRESVNRVNAPMQRDVHGNEQMQRDLRGNAPHDGFCR